MMNARPMYMRVAVAAGSLALVASAVAAPAVFAQDGPDATINNLVEAIEAKDFGALPTYFCDEFSDQMGGLDLASMTEGMPPGVDIQSLLDAFIIDVDVESADIVSQNESEAIIELVGSMSMSIDADKVGPFVEGLIGSMGEEATPDMVEMFSGMLLAEFQAEATDISAQVTLVRDESGAWRICSDLGTSMGGADTSEDATVEASMDPAAEESAPAE